MQSSRSSSPRLELMLWERREGGIYMQWALKNMAMVGLGMRNPEQIECSSRFHLVNRGEVQLPYFFLYFVTVGLGEAWLRIKFFFLFGTVLFW